MNIRLTQKQVPNNSLLAVFSDVHIPHHDARALGLLVEAAEAVGVTHLVFNGDILDCGVLSRHPGKKGPDLIRHGTLAESIESGRWFLDWAFTRPSWYLLGNHEAWVEKHIAADPGMAGTVEPADLFGLPRSLVYPSTSRIRLGSLNIEHGHGFFPSGTGGQNPGSRIKTLAPDQTTIIGHLHRKFATYWTTRDEHDRQRTRAAFGNGHVSLESAHTDYAGNYPNWQVGMTLVRVYWEGDRCRFSVYPVEVHRDRRNRPIFELWGKVYK